MLDQLPDEHWGFSKERRRGHNWELRQVSVDAGRKKKEEGRQCIVYNIELARNCLHTVMIDYLIYKTSIELLKLLL